MSFVPRGNFQKAFAQSTQMRSFMDHAAKIVAGNVRAIAPVRFGDYRDSIDSGVVRKPNVGWVGQVGSDDFKWHWIEFGTVDTPTFAPLRKGLERSGLKSGPALSNRAFGPFQSQISTGGFMSGLLADIEAAS